MCLDPGTLSMVSMGANALGTIMGMGAADDAGDAQAAMYGYKAAVARNNQIIGDMRASMETEKGERDAELMMMKTGQMKSSQRAAFGANGIDVSSGSAARVQGDTEAMGRFNTMTIRSNAARTAFGYKVQGLSYGAEAAMDDASGANALMAAENNKMATLIGGITGIADKYGKFKSAGVGTDMGGPTYTGEDYPAFVFG